MTSLGCVEGVPFELDSGLREPLRRALQEVQRRVRPTSPPLLEQPGGRFTISGIVGTVELRPHLLLDIAPKTEPRDDWVTATLDLLLPATRTSVAGDRRGGLAGPRHPLDVLAAIYAERLGRAVRRDGPLLLMERDSAVRQMLVGKLDVTRWARTCAWKPQSLPVAFQTLSADNPYTRAMAHVAELLAGATSAPQVRGRLLRLSRELRPGAAPLFALDHADARRPLPTQWGAYSGAWDIVVSVLSRKSLLGSRGRRHGVSLAVEAWALLETLLSRALLHAVRVARNHGRQMASPPKHSTGLIQPVSNSPGRPRGVEPDGRLTEGDSVVATFEAKYSRGDGAEPHRSHVFQALATAAACGSPLAVLVYPDEFEPVRWDTSGFGGYPASLVSIGLGLFGYRRGEGDRERGRRLLELLGDTGGARPSATPPQALQAG